MNFDALDEIIRKNTDLHICPICGTPFRQYHSRQRTCGTDECKRLWKNTYLRERRVRLIAENPEAFREYHADAQRKSRNKKKNLMIADRNLKKAQEYWERRAAQQYISVSDGTEYADRQIADTLAKVPKIDVSGFERGNKE